MADRLVHLIIAQIILRIRLQQFKIVELTTKEILHITLCIPTWTCGWIVVKVYAPRSPLS